MSPKSAALRMAALVLLVLAMTGSTVHVPPPDPYSPIAKAPVVAAPDTPDGPAIADCADRNLCVPWSGGMRILSSLYAPGAATCTAGFMTRGRTTADAYLLSAGHCFAEGDVTTSSVFDVAGSMNGGQRCRKVEVFPTYCRMLGGNPIGTSRAHDAATDTALVPVASPLPREMNALFIGDGQGHVTSVARAGSLDTRSVVCHVGVTSGVTCGRITNLDVTGRDGLRLVGADASTDNGDSGGPVYLATDDPDHLTAVGITVQSGPACLLWWTCGKQLLFVPIWELETIHDIAVCTTPECGLRATTGDVPRADFAIMTAEGRVGDSIEVVDRSVGGSEPPTYDWGDGTTSTGPAHRYTVPGQYLVIQNVDNDAGRAAAYHTLSIGPTCPESAPDPSGAALIGTNLPLVGAACAASAVGAREVRFVGSHDPSCGTAGGPVCHPTMDALRAAMETEVDAWVAELAWPPVSGVAIGCAPPGVGPPTTGASSCADRRATMFWVSAVLRETNAGETNTFRGAAGSLIEGE